MQKVKAMTSPCFGINNVVRADAVLSGTNFNEDSEPEQSLSGSYIKIREAKFEFYLQSLQSVFVSKINVFSDIL